jgi:hypothetical protein
MKSVQFVIPESKQQHWICLTQTRITLAQSLASVIKVRVYFVDRYFPS